jgi:hypothetical protein
MMKISLGLNAKQPSANVIAASRSAESTRFGYRFSRTVQGDSHAIGHACRPDEKKPASGGGDLSVGPCPP